MICQRCLLRASVRVRNDSAVRSREIISNGIRAREFSTIPARCQAVSPTAGTNAIPSREPPAATSTSAAQPFSTLLTPSTSAAGVKSGKGAAPPIAVVSSVPAGTPLKGLNLFKNKSDPVAMEDSEYPSWLWTTLGAKKEKGAAAADQGDLYSKSKKQRRVAAKRLRKQQLLNPESLVPPVPLHEQSIDLPAGDGTLKGAKTANAARADLTDSMRQKRRATIKEDNFLRTM